MKLSQLLAASVCALILATGGSWCWAQQKNDESGGGVESESKNNEGDSTDSQNEPAEDPQPQADEEPVPLEKQVADAALAGHNAWMLTSCALVLFMTAPGLALFYSGLVRRKNVLGVMMQCIFLMGLMTVLWAIFGYSLAFGSPSESETNAAYAPYIGNAEFLFMNNVQRTWDEVKEQPVEPMTDGDGAPPIPVMTHMLFQGMFFIITPALICGAFAERMKFSSMVVFSIAWGVLVYCPLCHWVWDGGILASALFLKYS